MGILGNKVAFSLGLFLVAFGLRDWIIQNVSIPTSIILGAIVLLYLAYIYDIKTPYNWK